MKKWVNIFLLVEAAICIFLCVVGGESSSVLGDILSFPFTQLGDAIRELSLSGSAGNIIAWCLYVMICFIPIAVGIVKFAKKRFKAEDSLLIVMGSMLFVIMYYMINTSEFVVSNGIAMDKEIKVAVLGATIYSIIAGYVILITVRKVRNADNTSLKKYLNIIFFVVNVVFVYAIFGSGLKELLEGLDNLAMSNQGFENELLLTKIFMCARYVIDVILNLMSIYIVMSIQRFIEELDFENVSDRAVQGAKKISRLCVWAVVMNVIMYIVHNVVQIILADMIHVIKSAINIPIVSVIVMLVFMIMAQFVLDAKKIKEENDMFI